jgi:hypothetical protein
MDTVTTGPESDDPPPTQMSLVFDDGSLLVIAADGSATEIPLTRQDALALARALVVWVNPAVRLQAAPSAGRA